MEAVRKQRATYACAAFAVLFLGIQIAADAQWTWSPQTGRWINLQRLPMETPELQLVHARGLMLEGRYREAMRETEKFMDFYGDSDLADQNQFLRGEITERRGRYLQAVNEYQQVVANYPGSDLHEDVIDRQYAIGDRLFQEGLENQERWFTFFRNRPMRQAIEVYNTVIDNQPFTPAAAEAQYKVGLCKFTLGEYTEAAFEYRRVIEDYSGSEWVADASHGLVQCYYRASRPPAYDQTPSRMTITAIDRFRSQFPNDERLEGMEEKRQEMRERMAEQRVRTAEYYEGRRQFESARIYYQIVVDEFGDTAAAAEAQQWLDDYGPPQEGPLAVLQTVSESN